MKDVEIVLSTTWRDAYSLNELKRFCGEGLSRFITDVTPSAPIGVSYERERECMAWLRKFGKKPFRYLAIDDQKDHFYKMPLLLIDESIGYQPGMLTRTFLNES